MRRLPMAAALLLCGALASAQTVITITTAGAGQDKTLDGYRKALNAETCESVGLPPTCTQAQARAKNSDLNIYSDIVDLYVRYVHKQTVATAKLVKAQREAGDLCKWWIAPTTTRTAKDALCTSIGLAADCELCQ